METSYGLQQLANQLVLELLRNKWRIQYDSFRTDNDSTYMSMALKKYQHLILFLPEKWYRSIDKVNI